jgi:hypothetical protein
MKHLFWIHSHITFLTAQKIIEENDILRDDCIFLTSRNYITSELKSYKFCSVYNLTNNKWRIWAGINVFKTYKNIHKFDSNFKKIMPENFYFYTPQTMADLPNIIISHKNCQRYFIMEEGTGSYNINQPTLFVGWKYYFKQILKLFFQRLYAVKESFATTTHIKFGCCYGFGANVFPTVPKEKIVKIPLPFEKITLQQEVNAIIVLDYLQGLDINFPFDKYIDTIKTLCSFFAKNTEYKCIGYKFHPSHYFSQQKFITELRKIFKETEDITSIKYIEIPQETSLENIAYSYHPDFYGLFSSSLFYATITGCKVYGINNLLISKEKTYSVLFKKIPDKPEEELII